MLTMLSQFSKVQLETPPLKLLAPSNIRSCFAERKSKSKYQSVICVCRMRKNYKPAMLTIVVTAAVFQLDMSPLKLLAPLNIKNLCVTKKKREAKVSEFLYIGVHHKTNLCLPL